MKIREILARIDAVDAPIEAHIPPEEHNAILLQRSLEYDNLSEDLEEAVREHVVELDKAVQRMRRARGVIGNMRDFEWLEGLL